MGRINAGEPEVGGRKTGLFERFSKSPNSPI
jgi:hypothetical protein